MQTRTGKETNGSLDMKIITYGKPDAKRAAEILGPALNKMWEKQQKEKNVIEAHAVNE